MVSRAPNAMLQAQKVLTTKWEANVAPRQQSSKEAVEAFEEAFQDPLDSAKRKALRELMKFDLAEVECMFEEAC